jgi:hypothetical protein
MILLSNPYCGYSESFPLKGEVRGSIASLFYNFPYFYEFKWPLTKYFSLPSLSMEKAGAIDVQPFSRQ